MKLPISIIIPTLNEEAYLPRLLESIKNQTQQPAEIIVSDSNSSDNTRQIAQSFECKIGTGGNQPGMARNNGAKIATQDIFLFLDADVILSPKFLEHTINEMQTRNLDITTCFINPLSDNKIDHWAANFNNFYNKITEKIYPHAMGFCIFARSVVHKDIHGFDETIRIMEDTDYIQRAIKRKYTFGYLLSEKVNVSFRSLDEEGKIHSFLKYMYIELHGLLLGPIRSKKLAYEFGKHS